MDNWDEIRTAYQVARLGTVSGAAEVLGVHHATVIRHIDALETRLSVKLFQRHARGYTATEAGEDLLRVAQTTDDQFGQLVGRIKGRGTDVSGEIVVTSLVMLATKVAPLLAAFQAAHPNVVIRYLTGDRLFRLEYGEAHLAIRAGPAPDQPDNVIQPLADQEIGLYASKDYVAAHGIPASPEEYATHRFVGHDDAKNRAPHFQWMAREVPRERVTYRSLDYRAMMHAIITGAGMGFMAKEDGQAHPNLVEIYAPREEWSAPLWLVTHVDLHRTSKVQALVKFFKEQSKGGLL
ncbi:LysR family transcriptional regulator [Sulfitobacter sp. SK012]|uniref:LysR family transcriptional regulator n=1 Tax=Sulfitobacter sp. SK012 TaxID=1389005 RepID=UPI000E0A5092|nr:LysR family transcriptional regulator [Sulfitobacter sp. SK012]AXI45029.1 LysR family transcriptional regulator [Sulfitobacter sp. SK012]